MKYFKIIALSFSLVLISLLAFVGVANAQSFRTGDNITVSSGETVNAMLLSAGRNIDIAGTVNGDVYCAGSNITISGSVTGDVICAGQNVTISGRVDGDVRLAGQTVTVSGTVTGSASIATQTLTIGNNGSVGRDLFAGTQTAALNGKVGRDATIAANDLAVNGVVERDVRGEINSVNIGSSGKIGGNLDYTGQNDPNISQNGVVTGKVTRHAPREQGVNQNSVARAAVTFLIYMVLAMLLMGLVAVWLIPGVVEESSEYAIQKPGVTLLVGAAASFLVPIIIFMLFVSVVGIPLAIIFGLLWVVIVMLSGTFAAYLLARSLLRNLKSPVSTILIGVLLLTLLYIIPIVNFFAVIFAYLFGTGMILTQSRKLYYRPAVTKNHKVSES